MLPISLLSFSPPSFLSLSLIQWKTFDCDAFCAFEFMLVRTTAFPVQLSLAFARIFLANKSYTINHFQRRKSYTHYTFWTFSMCEWILSFLKILFLTKGEEFYWSLSSEAQKTLFFMEKLIFWWLIWKVSDLIIFRFSHSKSSFVKSLWIFLRLKNLVHPSLFSF